MGYFRKKRFSLGEVVGLLAIALAIIGYAASVTVPNTFSPGTTISSTEVNDNFTALKNGIDENKSVAACSPEVLTTTLTTSVSDIASVSITVPGPGRVTVSGSGTFQLNNDGSRWAGDVLMTETSGGTGADVRNSWAGPAGLPTGLFASPFHEQAIFEVAAEGTFTYFLAGQNILTQPVTVLSANVCAVFTPN
jgi:hypothetical protein